MKVKSFQIRTVLLMLFSVMTLVLFNNCASDDKSTTTDVESSLLELDSKLIEQMYFPTTNDNLWVGVSPLTLGWKTAKINELKSFLDKNNSTGFIVLYNGRIAIETYWRGWDRNSSGPVASVGKSYVSLMIGKLSDQGKININNTVSSYIGDNWSNSSLSNERIVTVKDLLSMTSGLNDLRFKKYQPGSAWEYSRSYKALYEVIAAVTGQDSIQDFYNLYGNSIGVKSTSIGTQKDFSSSTRDMARIGLMLLNNGQWNANSIVSKNYVSTAISSSQTYNKSYGLLFWLNGKESHMFPKDPTVYSGSLATEAPGDMFAAMGYEERRIYVVPSRKLVIIRQGDATTYDPQLAASAFDRELWSRIMQIF